LLKTEGPAAVSKALPTPATAAALKKENGLKAEGDVKKEGAAPAAAAAAGGAGWKVLQDDYLMGSKLTDWDKAVHSSEEEEDDE